MSNLKLISSEDEEIAVKSLKYQLENEINISEKDVEEAKNSLSGLISYNNACIECWKRCKTTQPEEQHLIYDDLILKATNSNKKYRKLFKVLCNHADRFSNVGLAGL